MNVFEHFIKESSDIYVGNHLIADLWGIENHFDEQLILDCFEQACRDAGATVLFKHCHPFGEGCGTTGVIVLSESHASWHHYTEVNLITIDIFMCGNANPHLAMPRIKDFWKPKLVEIQNMRRGQVLPHKLPISIAQQLA